MAGRLTRRRPGRLQAAEMSWDDLAERLLPLTDSACNSAWGFIGKEGGKQERGTSGSSFGPGRRHSSNVVPILLLDGRYNRSPMPYDYNFVKIPYKNGR